MRRRTLTDTLNKERKRKFVPCHCNDCKGKLVDPRTIESHQEISSQIPMNTSQEVYEDIDTESSHSSALTEVSMDINRGLQGCRLTMLAADPGLLSQWHDNAFFGTSLVLLDYVPRIHELI